MIFNHIRVPSLAVLFMISLATSTESAVVTSRSPVTIRSTESSRGQGTRISNNATGSSNATGPFPSPPFKVSLPTSTASKVVTSRSSVTPTTSATDTTASFDKFFPNNATRSSNVNGSTDIPVGPRIIGGQVINIRDFPFIVVVLVRRDKKISACGGGVISKNLIVTAAHCLIAGSWHALNEDVRVAVGASHLDYITEGMLRTIDAYSVPSSYIDDRWNGDIALLSLVDPIEYSDRVQPVLLPKKHEEDNWVNQVDKATIAGFGRYDDNNTDGQLRLMHVTILPNWMCRSGYEAELFNEVGFICSGTGRKEVRKTTCKGDSGAPLVVQAKRGWVVLGLGSWGFDCGRHSGLSYQTRVSEFVDWINTIAKAWEKYPHSELI